MREFAKLNPAVQLVYFLSVILVVMFDKNPVILLISVLFGLLICLRINSRVFLKDLPILAAILFISTISNPFFSQNGATTLLFINDMPVTLESLVYGLSVGVMLISVISWFKIFSFTMTSDKIMYLFGRYFPSLALTVSMIFKFIPQIIRQAENTKRVQQALGQFSAKSIMQKLKGSINIFSIVLTWSLENALDTAASMKARGYGQKNRSSFMLYRFTALDLITLLIVLILDVVLFLGIALGKTKFDYYPIISTVDTTGLALAVYISFGVLALLPFYLDFKESLKWKYYILKI
ncbi:MAG TPA: energy-coupling factor transporter transmembrane protein EcfT [Clostridiales bacterium]|nr:energy-coupling factor transporter transmembrane protein EcfT [Clostridiales bacterium]